MPCFFAATGLSRYASILAFTAVFAAPAAAEESTLVHEGVERTYQLHVPASYDDVSPVPLVIMLHGRSGSGERMAALTGFNERADEHGFIVAYPDGLDGAWNYVHGVPGYRDGPDDPGFIVGLAEALSRQYRIDERRIYVTGISNGGFMAQRLACRAADRFAAFASVAAAGFASMPSGCAGRAAVSILYIHGTADARVPWRGLQVERSDGRRELVAMPVLATLEFWSRRSGCGKEIKAQALPRRGGSPGTSVQFLTATECEAGAEVSLYAVTGGGHNWPGSTGVIASHVAGRVNMDFHASDVIWAFFKRHAR